MIYICSSLGTIQMYRLNFWIYLWTEMDMKISSKKVVAFWFWAILVPNYRSRNRNWSTQSVRSEFSVQWVGRICVKGTSFTILCLMPTHGVHAAYMIGSRATHHFLVRTLGHCCHQHFHNELVRWKVPPLLFLSIFLVSSSSFRSKNQKLQCCGSIFQPFLIDGQSPKQTIASFRSQILF